MGNKLPDPDSVARIVALAYGKMNHGGSYWCYLAVKPSRYDAFQQAMQSKQYNIQHFEQDGFGEVVVSGEGVIPPDNITKKVAELFKVPVRELFADVDPQKKLNDKIEALNQW